MTAEGKKFDGDKPPMELLSNLALRGTAAVLAFGRKKYNAHNWRGGIAWGRIAGACLRHLMSFIGGEDLDPETGLPHLDHLACEVMFLQEFYHTRKDLDDRYKALAGGCEIHGGDACDDLAAPAEPSGIEYLDSGYAVHVGAWKRGDCAWCGKPGRDGYFWVHEECQKEINALDHTTADGLWSAIARLCVG